MSELSWQRTPLITIAFFLLKQLKQLVTNITNLIPVFAAIFVMRQELNLDRYRLSRWLYFVRSY